MSKTDDENELLETTAILPIYYDGIRTAIIDGMLHLLFWVRQPRVDDPTATERVVVSRMVTRTAQSGQGRDIVNTALELAAEASKVSH